MKKQSLFGRWMQNNYFLFLFAVLVSLVIWIYMSFNSTDVDTTFTISDVPIQTELSDESRELGLQVFTAGEPKATVTVSGNRTVLGLLNENDITVTATAGSINSAGNYTLPVSAAKRTSRSNFEIKSYSPSTLSVTVDYFKESEFQIQDGVVIRLEEGYYGSTTMSHSSVKISGPQTEVLKIKKVVAKANISDKLSSSTEVDADLVLLDENNNEISSKMLDMSTESVKATVTVLPEKTVKVEPVFVNKPEGLNITEDMITITPSDLLIAGPADTLEKMDSVQLEPIDFSSIRNEKVDFDNLGIKIPENCKSINNYTTAKVSLDLSGLSSKRFTVDRFIVEGLSDEYSSTVTSKSIDVIVIGSKSNLEKLSASQITAVIDTSDSSGKTGSVEMPVNFRFSDTTGCWAYGKYQANITITKK